MPTLCVRFRFRENQKITALMDAYASLALIEEKKPPLTIKRSPCSASCATWPNTRTARPIFERRSRVYRNAMPTDQRCRIVCIGPSWFDDSIFVERTNGRN
jgi:hypothetical protein